jgi:hypothetical protein
MDTKGKVTIYLSIDSETDTESYVSLYVNLAM